MSLQISETQAPFILLLYCLDHFNVQSACATSGHHIHIPASQKAEKKSMSSLNKKTSQKLHLSLFLFIPIVGT